MNREIAREMILVMNNGPDKVLLNTRVVSFDQNNGENVEDLKNKSGRQLSVRLLVTSFLIW